MRLPTGRGFGDLGFFETPDDVRAFIEYIATPYDWDAEDAVHPPPTEIIAEVVRVGQLLYKYPGETRLLLVRDAHDC